MQNSGWSKKENEYNEITKYADSIYIKMNSDVDQYISKVVDFTFGTHLLEEMVQRSLMIKKAF